MMDLELGGSFIPGRLQMISAVSEVSHPERTWNKIDCKRGVWLIPNEGIVTRWMIFRSHQKGRSEGFGGAELTFTVTKERDVDVEPYKLTLQGPWSGNAHSMFMDTGYDIRNKYETWGCISEDQGFSNGGNWIFKNLVYFDKEPTIGTFNRIEELAESMARERGKRLYYYSESFGGSSCSYTKFAGEDSKRA